ncbi:hypothetical protein [Candidatus Enterococcus ferrettii]|uniref:DUF5082 domain-containing protein n=1 Tax=Candidatus Enterococcus ferrettii TaxID=2815324 RepID=A0ABV0ES21_9ENTE|nr:hypothetical protein [Enterococcus sp. 665A]MBO1340380.1 hypothetical protein [Enterococcus sp. 665A]
MESERIIEKLQKRIGKEQAKKNTFRQRLEETHIYIQQLENQKKELVQENQKQEEQLSRLELHYRQQLFMKQAERIWQEFQQSFTEQLLLTDQSFELALSELNTMLVVLEDQIGQLIGSTLTLEKKMEE